MAGPLTGLQVVEIGDASEVAGKLMADAGADVIRVEPTQGGRIAIALEPRGASSPELTSANGQLIANDLEALGFENVRMESNGRNKRPAVCVLGLKAVCQ